MKKIILVLLVLSFAYLDLSAQALDGKDKQIVNIDGRSKSVKLDTLAKFYNPLKTPYGYTAKADSNIQIKNVSFYDNETIINNTLKLPHVQLRGLNFGGYTEGGVKFSVLRLDDNYEEDRTILFQIFSGNGQGWGRKFSSSSQGRSFSLNRDFFFLTRMPSDTLYQRNQGVFIDAVVNSDKARRGQVIYNLAGTANSKTSEMMIIQDSLKNPLFLFTHIGVKNHSWAEHEANASVIMYQDSTVINNTLKLNNGLKILELSYVPENSNDLQAETINAEVGTLWMLNVSGSMYLVTKISETKIARTPFAEW